MFPPVEHRCYLKVRCGDPANCWCCSLKWQRFVDVVAYKIDPSMICCELRLADRPTGVNKRLHFSVSCVFACLVKTALKPAPHRYPGRLGWRISRRAMAARDHACGLPEQVGAVLAVCCFRFPQSLGVIAVQTSGDAEQCDARHTPASTKLK